VNSRFLRKAKFLEQELDRKTETDDGFKSQHFVQLFSKKHLEKRQSDDQCFQGWGECLGKKKQEKKLELQTSFLFRKQCRQTGSFGDAAPKKRRDYYLL